MQLFPKKHCLRFSQHRTLFNNTPLDISWYYFLNDSQVQQYLKNKLKHIPKKNITLIFEKDICDPHKKKLYKWTHHDYKLNKQVQEKINTLFPGYDFYYGPYNIQKRCLRYLPMCPLYGLLFISLIYLGMYIYVTLSINNQTHQIITLKQSLKDSQHSFENQNLEKERLYRDDINTLFSHLKNFSQYPISFQNITLTKSTLSLMGQCKSTYWETIQQHLLTSLHELHYKGQFKTLSQTKTTRLWKGDFTLANNPKI